MARRPRIHLPGGIYYVIELTSAHRVLFAEADDARLLERLFANALRRTKAHALAYCWLPSAIHLVVQIETIPLGRVLQGFMSHYARYVHERTHTSGHFFVGRYRSLLIDPAEWLAPLIRYLHYLPLLSSLVETPDRYEHSSHHVLVGLRRSACVEPYRTLTLLSPTGDRDAYARLMHQVPSSQEIQAFTLPPGDSVLGSASFKASLPRTAFEHRSALSLEQIITQVARLLGVRRDELASRSRARRLAFARALIAWHATERNVATLAEVSRRLRRDPSTLSIGMRRHAMSSPEWFRLDALRHLKPLAGEADSK